MILVSGKGGERLLAGEFDKGCFRQVAVPYQDSLYCFTPLFIQLSGLNKRKDIPNLLFVFHDEGGIAVVGEGDEPSNFKRTSLGAGAACCGEGFLSGEILFSIEVVETTPTR